jgi:long-chain acyl-CoA synthetase
VALDGRLGALDRSGFLTLHDRSKDLIISGGSNIYPVRSRRCVARPSRVAEAAVVGRPDREWAQVPVAFYVVRPGHTFVPDPLERLCLDNLAHYKRPRGWFAVEALPKNSYGKVLKKELRELLALS